MQLVGVLQRLSARLSHEALAEYCCRSRINIFKMKLKSNSNRFTMILKFYDLIFDSSSFRSSPAFTTLYISETIDCSNRANSFILRIDVKYSPLVDGEGVVNSDELSDKHSTLLIFKNIVEHKSAKYILKVSFRR